MNTFDTVQELLQPGETALCVLTDGRNFTFHPDGSGSTGFWKINPVRQADCVVVFRQGLRHGQRYVELFTAQHDGVVGANEEGRYTIKLLNMQLVDSTEHSWQKFANAGQNPVRYVTRPAT